MSSPKPENEAREQRILSAAAELIIRQGYDKTTMGEIADEAGVSRGIVYLHFENKEKLFEALVQHEGLLYARAWQDYLEADPGGGTIGGLYRAVLHAVTSRPFMAAMMRRDRRVVGSYLRKPDNMFAAAQSAGIGQDLVRAMQEAGVIRTDLDPAIISHLIDILGFGLLSIDQFKHPDEIPPFEPVMEAMAEMMDRMLTPAGGGNREAGKALIRQLAESSRTQLEQMKKSSER